MTVSVNITFAEDFGLAVTLGLDIAVAYLLVVFGPTVTATRWRRGISPTDGQRDRRIGRDAMVLPLTLLVTTLRPAVERIKATLTSQQLAGTRWGWCRLFLTVDIDININIPVDALATVGRHGHIGELSRVFLAE